MFGFEIVAIVVISNLRMTKLIAVIFLRYKYKTEDLVRFAKWQDGKYTRNLVDTGDCLTTKLLSADDHCKYKTSEKHIFWSFRNHIFWSFRKQQLQPDPDVLANVHQLRGEENICYSNVIEIPLFHLQSNYLFKFLQLAHKHTETHTLKRTNTHKDKPLMILTRFTTTRKLIASCGFWREVLLRRGFYRYGGGGGGGDDEGNWYERDLDISMDFGAGIFKVQPMKIKSRYNWCKYFLGRAEKNRFKV